MSKRTSTITPNQNDILTLEQCADWLKLSPREVSLKAKAGIIPAYYINQRVIRFHVGTVLDSFNRRLSTAKRR
jgi:hypothetical protein